MRSLAALLLATALLFSAAPSTPIAAADYPCAAGYVQIEDQAWWRDATGEAWPGRHVHQQLCWPTGVVSGTFSQPVRVLLHKQPPGAKLTRLRITDGSGATLWSKTTGLGLPDANGNQSLTVTVTFDTSALSTGIHEMRLAAYVSQPSGAQQFVSSGHALYVRSMTGGATGRNFHETRGWYPIFLYVNARTRTPLADFREMSPGDTFDTQCAAPSGEDPTACTVWADPNAHDGYPGIPILPDAGGPSRRTATLPALSPGLHKIAIRSEATADLGGVSDGTDSGLLVITVLVQ